MLSDQIFWYLTRSAGLMSWLASAGAIIVGLLLSSRVLGRRPTIPWLLDVHRYLSSMAMVFLAVHLVTLWADTFVQLSVADLVVPGRAEIPGLSPNALLWGVFSGWIMVAVYASSLVKKWLPSRAWHTLHLGSFGSLVGGAAHGLSVGSDVDNRVLVAVSVSLLTAIVLLTGIRCFRFLTDRKYRYELTQAELEGEDAVRDQPRRRPPDRSAPRELQPAAVGGRSAPPEPRPVAARERFAPPEPRPVAARERFAPPEHRPARPGGRRDASAAQPAPGGWFATPEGDPGYPPPEVGRRRRPTGEEVQHPPPEPRRQRPPAGHRGPVPPHALGPSGVEEDDIPDPRVTGHGFDASTDTEAGRWDRTAPLPRPPLTPRDGGAPGAVPPRSSRQPRRRGSPGGRPGP